MKFLLKIMGTVHYTGLRVYSECEPAVSRRA
jgi:hypothetical protein